MPRSVNPWPTPRRAVALRGRVLAGLYRGRTGLGEPTTTRSYPRCRAIDALATPSRLACLGLEARSPAALAPAPAPAEGRPLETVDHDGVEPAVAPEPVMSWEMSVNVRSATTHTAAAAFLRAGHRGPADVTSSCPG